MSNQARVKGSTSTGHLICITGSSFSARFICIKREKKKSLIKILKILFLDVGWPGYGRFFGFVTRVGRYQSLISFEMI